MSVVRNGKIVKDFFVTTVDNPFNYFTEFDKWLQYDNEKGYYTLSLVSRLTVPSDELSEESNDLALEKAIFDMVDVIDPTLYRLTFKDE